MPIFPDVVYFELPPDWVCEVLSPSTSPLDRLKKLPIYAAYGVPYAWLIDPSKRTLEIYGLENGSLNLVSAYAGEESVCAAPFEAIPLELRALWI
jgi:Uma2 family endonuclease